MIKVLFTGGGGAGNEALWRLLGDRYELHFGDADASSIDPSIPPQRRHALPWASSADFAQGVAGLCRGLGIDVLVPGVDEELLLLARAAAALAPTRLLLPDAPFVQTMTDKWTTIQALSAHRLPVPASRLLSDGPAGLSFPCIAKPRRGRGSRGVHIVNSAAQVQSMLQAAGGAAESTLLQERVEGVEYTVQMMCDAQMRLHAIAPVQVSVKRGITLRAQTDDNPVVIAACRAIHAALPAAGCYNIQLMLTAEGRALPFEINPRVSTTLCLCVAAGLDPIDIFLRDQAPSHLMSFSVPLQLKRHWTNHFLRD